MPLIILCILAVALCGCMPAFQASEPQVIKVQGKPITYVALAWHNGQGVNAFVIDRFDEHANLIAHDMGSNSGILETILPSIVNTGVPTAANIFQIPH